MDRLNEIVDKVLTVGGMFDWVIYVLENGGNIPNNTDDILQEYARYLGLSDVVIASGEHGISITVSMSGHKWRYDVGPDNWYTDLSNVVGHSGFDQWDFVRELFYVGQRRVTMREYYVQ